MPSPKGFILYRIWYGKRIAYLGRTKQLLQDRIRGHMFAAPMHRAIDIHNVTRIEYTELETEANMNLYEIYLINLWKPPLNVDDKARDGLTITLPELEWKEFRPSQWEKWLIKLDGQELRGGYKSRNERIMMSELFGEGEENDQRRDITESQSYPVQHRYGEGDFG